MMLKNTKASVFLFLSISLLCLASADLNVTTSVSSSSISMVWTMAANLSAYNYSVEYVNSTGLVQSLPAGSISECSGSSGQACAVLNGLSAGQVYNVTILADSAVQYTKNITVAPTAVDTSSIKFMDTNPNSVIVTWTKPANTSANTYSISVTGNGVNVTPNSVDFSSITPSVTLSGVTPGQTVTLHITVISNNVSSVVADKDYTRQPTAVNGSSIIFVPSTPNDVIVTWTKPVNTSANTYSISVTGNGVNVTPNIVDFASSTTPSVTLSGVTPGQTVTLHVTVISNNVSSTMTDKVYTRPPLAVSVDTIAFNDLNPNSIIVTWTKPVNTSANTYSISVTGNGVSVTPNSVDFSSIPSVTLSGVTPGQTVTLHITVISNNVSSAVTDQAYTRLPASVGDVTVANIGNTSATVSWTAAGGVVSGYEVRVAPAVGVVVDPSAPVLSNATTVVRLSALAPGQNYSVTVVTHGGNRTSQPTVKTFTTQPSAVTVDVKQINPFQVNVSWTASVVAPGQTVSYELSYRPSLRDPTTKFTTTTVKASNQLIAVTPGERYEFIVRPILADGTPGLNATAEITLAPLAPGNVTVTAGSITPSSVNLTWIPVDPVRSFGLGYKIFYKPTDNDPNNAEEKFFVVLLITSSTVRLENLSPGRQYLVRVFTVSVSEYKMSDNSANVNVTAQPVCTTILTDVSGDGATNNLTLAYTVNQDYFTSYIINCNGENRIRLAVDVSGAKTVEFDLETGTQYSVTVWVESYGIMSVPQVFTFATAPSSPDGLQILTEKQYSLTIRWNAVDSPSFVRIMNYDNSSLTQDIEANSTEYIYNDLVPYTVYKFDVFVVRFNKSSVKKSQEVRTQESPSSIVMAFNMSANTRNAYTSAHLQWYPPTFPRGKITKYVIRFSGTSNNTPDVYSFQESYPAAEIETPMFTYAYDTELLKGGRNYQINITAVNGAGEGDTMPYIYTTAVGSPFLANNTTSPTQLISSTGTTIKVNIVNVFSDQYGPVSNYSVIVYENDNRKVILNDINTWNDVHDSKLWNPYYATKECALFSNPSLCAGGGRSVTDSRKKRSVDPNTVSFEIGVAVADCTKKKTVCNGPLLPSKSYVVVLRAVSSSGFTDSIASSPMATSQSDAVWIAVVATLLGILVIVTIAALIVYIKFRRRSRCDRKSSRKPERPPSRPVRIQQFPDHFRFMSADSDFRFCEEYEQLKLVGVDQATEECRKDWNCGKNRFANICPYDWSRVKLSMMDDVSGSDYINANYMPGHNSKREFLVTQGPLAATVDDFWRMIWEQNCSAIVMLTKLIDNGRDKCVRYWPSNTNPIKYGDILVTIANEICYENFNVMEFKLQKDGHTRTVRHFFYKAWPDFGVPRDTESLLRFITYIRKKIGKSQPICVHCSAGVGRSGTYVLLDKLIQDMEAGVEHVDVFGAVHEMRRHRCLMVQTEQQYIFAHRAIRDIVEGVVRIDTLQPIGLTNKAYNEDEGVQLEVMA